MKTAKEEGKLASAEQHHGLDPEVRLSALQLMAAAVRCNHRVFVSQWESLLPDHAATALQPVAPTLFHLLLFDPSPRIRVAASFAITVLLEDSRPYLLQADDRVHGTASFTPYAVRLGAMVRELHTGLFYVVQHEPVPHVLAAALKTLVTLILNTPYFKLAVAASLVEFLAGPSFSATLIHRDRSARTNAIAVLTAALSTPKPVPGLGEAFPSASRAWFAALSPALDDPHPPLRAEALRAFAASARHHRPHVMQHWPWLLGQLKRLVLDRDAQVRNAVVQAVEKFTQSVDDAAAGTTPGDMDDIGVVAAPSIAGVPLLEAAQWRDLLFYILGPLLRDPLPATRALAVACHAHIPGPTLLEFQGPELATLVAELGAAAVGGAPAVQAAVCRVLGGWVYHPAVAECLHHIQDITHCLASMLGPSLALATRSRAAWAYANLCDALRASGYRGLPSADTLMTQLLQAALSMPSDNPKVTCHLVRAVGNLGHSAGAARLWNPLAPAGPSVFALITQLLVSAVGDLNVKVRWNGCHGLGLLLSNPALPAVLTAVQAEVTVAVMALTGALQNDENFKVRIQAGLALLGVDRQALTGPLLCALWGAVVAALQNMHVVANFEQYKASQLLRDQLFANLRRLVDLCTPLEVLPDLRPLLLAQGPYLLSVLDSIEVPHPESRDLDAALAQLAVSTAEAVVADEDHATTAAPALSPASTTFPAEFQTLRQFL
eukprot:EG_transcript_3900